MAFAENTADVARPEAFVVAVFTPPANDPLAPLPGALNVTNTPLSGLSVASLTSATKGAANEVLTTVLWGVPLLASIDAGGGPCDPAGTEAVPTACLAVILFILAAIIEGFISRAAIPYAMKAGIAVASSGIMMFYFVLLGYPRGDSRATR